MNDSLDGSVGAGMTWREAEHLAAEYMRSLGFADAEATPLGIDQGIDVTATGGAAQVKHFSTAPVGSPDVQRLVGAGHDAGRLLFFSLNGYTRSAADYADRASVALFVYGLDGGVSAANAIASRLERERFRSLDMNRPTSARDRVIPELREYGQVTSDSCGRMMNAINDILTDPVWAKNLTAERYMAEFEPVAREAQQLMDLLHDLNGAHPVGWLLNEIVRAEALAQRIGARFGLNYSDYLRWGLAQPAVTSPTIPAVA